jgi:uncharacterized protein (DUF2062 family)
LNRGSVSRAFAIGFFWAMVPMPSPAAAARLRGVVGMAHRLADAWLPLVVGSLMVSVVASASTYWAVRFFWNWNVGRQWRRRRAKRLAAA